MVFIIINTEKCFHVGLIFFMETVILQLFHVYLMNTKLKNSIYFKYNSFVISINNFTIT